MQSNLFEPLVLAHGQPMKNRFMLAPLTNQQSAPDGSATRFDVEWVERCAQGGYGLVQTCAATVQSTGRAFKGQLGIHSDTQLEGLKRMATVIRAGGALSGVQLHHAGHRAQPALGGVPAPASEDAVAGLRAMNIDQIVEIRDDFIRAARRAQQAGFDGVAVHGAFGFVVSEFLSPTLNRRQDRYGGSLENRSRFLFEILDGIRQACKPDFQIGLRLSVERYGLRVEELRDVVAAAFQQSKIDYLDLALWDSKQVVMDGPFAGRSMLSVFANLARGQARLGVAGKIRSARRALEVLEEGADFVLIGRAAILNSDFPNRVRQTPDFRAPELPVHADYLRQEGLSPPFINYMRTAWDGFVI